LKSGLFFFQKNYRTFVALNTKAEIEQLFLEHYEPLHRYAFTILKDMDDAKDIVQTVFTNLWLKRETLNITTSPKAYLYRSVYNESLNFIKKQEVVEKHNKLIGQEQERTDITFDKDEELMWKQKLENVLEQLPPQCREVFVKSRAEQKKYTEIAGELGIAVKTVEAHMSKALKLIRQIVRVFVGVICLYSDFI